MTAWAKELRKAGLDGNMDQLRARAFMDILLGIDSRPLGTDRDGANDTLGRGGGASCSDDRPGGIPSSPAPQPQARVGPLAGVIAPGFAGRVALTIPAATLLHLADRPGELGGIGPIDPKPEANTSDCYRSQVLLNLLSEVGATAARHPPE